MQFQTLTIFQLVAKLLIFLSSFFVRYCFPIWRSILIQVGLFGFKPLQTDNQLLSCTLPDITLEVIIKHDLEDSGTLFPISAALLTTPHHGPHKSFQFSLNSLGVASFFAPTMAGYISTLGQGDLFSGPLSRKLTRETIEITAYGTMRVLTPAIHHF